MRQAHILLASFCDTVFVYQLKEGEGVGGGWGLPRGASSLLTIHPLAMMRTAQQGKVHFSDFVVTVSSDCINARIHTCGCEPAAGHDLGMWQD